MAVRFNVDGAADDGQIGRVLFGIVRIDGFDQTIDRINNSSLFQRVR